MNKPHPKTENKKDRLLLRQPHFPQLKTLDANSYETLIKLNRLYYSRKDVGLSNDAIQSYKNLADNIALIIQQAQPPDTVFLLHLSKLLRQTLDLREKEGLVKHFVQYRKKRDAFMAENAIWIQNNLNIPNSKMVIWAHNGHIAHAKLEGSHRMGYYLNSYFKDKYYAVDFVFDEGYVRIFDFDDTRKYKPFFYSSSNFEKSIEYTLKHAALPIFFLDVSNIKSPSINSFFNHNKYQRVIGATYQNNSKKDYSEMPVLECFDGLIFVKKTKAAENIK